MDTSKNHLGFFVENSDDFAVDLRPRGIPEIVALSHSSRKKAQAPSASPHAHPNLEICHLISGIRTNVSGSETWYLNEGDLWVNKPGIAHSSSLSPSGPSSICYIEVAPPVAGECFLGLEPEEAGAFWQAFLDLPVCVCRCNGLCRELFGALRRLGRDPGASAAQLRALAHALLFSVHELLASAPEHVIHPAIERVRGLIEASSPKDQPGLEALARHAGLSLPHFKTLFKRNLGVPPAKFLQSRKLAAVAYELIETDFSLAELAERFGFSSVQYFTNVFKAYTGETPKCYRDARRSGR